MTRTEKAREILASYVVGDGRKAEIAAGKWDHNAPMKALIEALGLDAMPADPNPDLQTVRNIYAQYGSTNPDIQAGIRAGGWDSTPAMTAALALYEAGKEAGGG